MLTQTRYGGTQKNNVLTTTIKQNKNQKNSLTFILVNSWVGNKSSMDNDSDDSDSE